MPSLAEDLALLLLLDDETGRSMVDAGRRYRVVGSAILLDLVRAGRITITVAERDPHDTRPVVVDRAPTGDPVLDAALAALAAKAMRLGWATETIGHDCWRPLLDGLVDGGQLSRRESRVLRIKSWPAADGSREAEIRARIRAAVVDRESPREDTALLVTLLHSIGAVAAVLPAEDAATVQGRAAEIAAASWADGPLREAMRGMDAALLVTLLAAG